MRAAKIGREMPGESIAAGIPQGNKRGDNATKNLENYEEN